MDISLLIIFSAGAFAAFVSAMTGGAGLFTLSVMILMGLPPHMAIATNKLGAIGIFTGSLYRIRNENIVDREMRVWLSILGLAGGILGALVLVSINTTQVRLVAAVLILAVLAASYIGRSLGLETFETSPRRKRFGYAMFFLASSLTGFFGPGMGIITVFIMMGCFGQTIITARSNTMFPHLLMAISSLIVLAYNDYVAWLPGLSLMAGMLLGGYWGAHHALKKGNAFVKGIFQLIILLVALRLFFTQ